MYIISVASLSTLPPGYLTEAVVNDANIENKSGAADVAASQHVMVCALQELGSLVQSLNATASPLIQEPSTGKGLSSRSVHSVILFRVPSGVKYESQSRKRRKVI